MARLHSKVLTPPQEAEALVGAIQAFIAASRSPAAIEEGEELMTLRAGEYAIELRSGRVWFEIWHGARTLSRRILSAVPAGVGALDCTIQKFGGVTGRLTILDTYKPQTGAKRVAGERRNFAEQFRRMLYRQFPGWEVRSVSAGMDLQRSLSPVFPRAELVRGQHRIAAMAAPTKEDEPALLTFALIWFDYVRQRSGAGLPNELALFLPQGAGLQTAHRLRWLNSEMLHSRMFRFNEHGLAGEVDPQDLGNLETRVLQIAIPSHLRDELRAVLGRLVLVQGVGICPEITGGLSIRQRGVEFARVDAGRLSIGLQTKEFLPKDQWQRAEDFVRQMAAIPDLNAEERWLETQLRSVIGQVDARLRPEPVHGQVLTFAGCDRDLIDLLAITTDGRLAVIELKASEDIHLPFQALDYWMRVRWHVERGELTALFPGLQIKPKAPLLRLVAPALAFHSTHATVLRYFSPDIDVERIGINWNWKSNLKVVLRLRGGEEPQSQGGPGECRDY